MMDNKVLDAIVERFENAWGSKVQPELETFLPSDSRQRAKVLPELVMTELELKLRSGQSVRVEDYLKRFPQLTQNDSDLVRLVMHELLIRKSCDQDFKADYATRFPSIHERMKKATKAHPAFQGQATKSRDLKQRVNDRYQLKEVFARGGLGKIWRAYDHSLNRDVALKEVKDDRADSENIRKRLDREALITGALEHPGIIPIHDRGVFDDGRPFYVMRLVDGITLSKAISECHAMGSTQEKNRELNRLLSRFVDVCNTIEYAHSREIIHRDLKPANVLIGSYGETIVADWGLAKPVGVIDELLNPIVRTALDEQNLNDANVGFSEHSSEFTQDGDIVGSIGFMSPEQFAGDIGAVSYRSDVYALGAILFNILSNQRPELGGNQPAENCSGPLLSIALKAMSESPAERHVSPHQIADDIERFLNFDRVAAHEESFTEIILRKFRKSPRTSLMIASSLFLLVAVSSIAAILVSSERTRTAEARTKSEVERARAEEETFKAMEIQDLKVSQIRELGNVLAKGLELDNNAETISKRKFVDVCLAQSKKSEGDFVPSLFQMIAANYARIVEDYPLAIKMTELALEKYRLEPGNDVFRVGYYPYLAELCIGAERFDDSQKWIRLGFDEIEKLPELRYQLVAVRLAQAELKIRLIELNKIEGNETFSTMAKSALKDLDQALADAVTYPDERNDSAHQRNVLARQYKAKLEQMTGNPQAAVDLIDEILGGKEVASGDVLGKKILELKTNKAEWLGEAGNPEAGLELIEQVLADVELISGEVNPTQLLGIRKCKALLLHLSGDRKSALELIDKLLGEPRNKYRKKANLILDELNKTKSKILDSLNN